MEYLKLGASLYVPAIHNDIISIAKGLKYPNLKSVIIDTEDSITLDDLPFAYHHINKMLQALESDLKEGPLVFIRTRNPEEFERISRFERIGNIDGFVLPKFNVENMDEYMKTDIPGKFYMPILEKDIFSLKNLEKIRDFLLPYRDKILTMRIGATDLLGTLNLRREHHTTIYEVGVMNQLIANVVNTFKPFGFNITGAVWESFSEESREKLQQEVKLDLLNGLFGKSIIHPWQIDVVQDIYKVNRDDYEISLKLLEPYCPAVFKAYDRMNEKSTHSGWAKNIVEMAKIYGVKDC